MTGTAIPYFFGNDNLLLAMFLLNSLGISYVFILNGESIFQRIKSLFYYSLIKIKLHIGNRENMGN